MRTCIANRQGCLTLLYARTDGLGCDNRPGLVPLAQSSCPLADGRFPQNPSFLIIMSNYL